MKQIAGLSPVLFHLTDTGAAANILKAKRFELKPSDGTQAEEDIRQSYYMSTARSMTSSYIRKGVYGHSVVLELDGVKLAQRYPGAAVDYWGPQYYKGDDGTPEQTRHKNFEAEDRVYSPTPFIPCLPYIKAIYCMVSKGASHRAQTDMYAIRRLCLIYKIPLLFFDNKEALLVRDKRKAIPYKPVNPGADPTAYEYPREVLEREALNPRRASDELACWYALWVIPKKPNMDSYDQLRTLNNKRVLDKYSGLGYSDAISSFMSELHNAKSQRYGRPSKAREHLDRIVGLMRAEHLTPKEFIDKLRDKWYPRYSIKNYAAVEAGAPYLGTGGIYVSVKPTSTGTDTIVSWLTDMGVDKDFTVDVSELHCTVMYSPTAPKYTLDTGRITRGRVLGFDLFGPDSNTLVMRLWSPELQERHAAWKGVGCVPTYDQYLPHVTVAFKTELPNNVTELLAKFNSKLREHPLYVEFLPETMEQLED